MVFIVDSSSLMKLEDNYPSDIFSPLWDLFYSLFDNGEMYSVKEVWGELKDSNELWDSYKDSFREINSSEIEYLFKIMSCEKFEVFIRNGLEEMSMGGFWADPYLIACAMAHNEAIIVTEENLNNKPLRKIPYICNELNNQGYNIKCLNILDFLRYNKIKF